MSTPSIAERVAAGVQWLDENVSDWLAGIDLERLDTSHCRHCVLGQLFGDYAEAPLRDRYYAAPPLGFQAAIDAGDSGDEYYAEHEDLTSEWVRVIQERRQAAGEAS